MNDRIRDILADLERVRENLLALSDDIWLGIDHNDNDAIEKGAQFKRTYNVKMAAFARAAQDLSTTIQQHTQVSVEEPLPAVTADISHDENERMIRELDENEPHTLDEDFEYRRPFGFVLQGQAYKDIVTWRRVYELVCSQLARCDGDTFKALPMNPLFTSKQGKKSFATDPTILREPLSLPHGLYAEANLSANNIRNRIKILLTIFNIPTSQFTVYLRQDRDADA